MQIDTREHDGGLQTQTNINDRQADVQIDSREHKGRFIDIHKQIKKIDRSMQGIEGDRHRQILQIGKIDREILYMHYASMKKERYTRTIRTKSKCSFKNNSLHHDKCLFRTLKITPPYFACVCCMMTRLMFVFVVRCHALCRCLLCDGMCCVSV